MRVSEEPDCIHLFRQNPVFYLPAFEISRSCRTASDVHPLGCAGLQSECQHLVRLVADRQSEMVHGPPQFRVYGSATAVGSLQSAPIASMSFDGSLDTGQWNYMVNASAK
jgi:hypothetical protein